MEYKNILNKDLRIAGVHIADLDMDCIKSFIGQWDEKVRIGLLTVFLTNRMIIWSLILMIQITCNGFHL